MMARTGMVPLVAAHLVGNAALLGLGYYWLGVGESDALHLLWSAALVLLFILGAVWLHGTSLAYFRDASQATLSTIPKQPGARWLPLAVLAIAVLALYSILEWWSPANNERVVQVASYLTLKLQRPVRPESVAPVLEGLWWIVEWLLVPMLLLPLASAVAVRGWSGFREPQARWWNRLAGAFSIAASVWVAWRLVLWAPELDSFGMETASFAARFGLAYLLFVVGCLASAFAISRGKPADTQPSTAVSP